MLSDSELALVDLGLMLKHHDYRFVTITPESHRRVVGRAPAQVANDLRGVFGWNQPFYAATLPAPMTSLLQKAKLVREEGELLRSEIRVSSIDDQLFVHSAFPTDDKSAVFFGPDTYRYVRLLRQSVNSSQRIVDVGCGSGVGGIMMAKAAKRIVLTDINDRALSFARVNAELASVTSHVEILHSDVLTSVEGTFDTVICNPPYLVDESKRTYRDGGGEHGTDFALRVVRESLERLPPSGRIILYTGTCIVDGVDVLRRDLAKLTAGNKLNYTYEELDPDIFGEELETPAYRDVERIAAVAFVANVESGSRGRATATMP